MIVVGAALQGIGLGFVFYEVIAIRVHEFGVPVWPTRTIHWVRATLRRRRDVHAQVDLSARLTLRASASVAKLSYAPPGPDASDAERFAWLELMVKALDDQLDALPETIRREVGAATAKAEQRDQAIEQAIADSDQRRRQALKRSLFRQGIGGAFVLVGLIVGTVGAVT